MSSNKKKIGYLIDAYNKIPQSAKASMWFLFANVFSKAVMVIFTPIFTRVMTTEEFSRYAVFQSWETILTVFATLNVSNYATAKALVEFKDDRDEFISSAQFLTIVLTIITFGVFILIKSFFSDINAFPVWVLILLFVDIISVAIFSFWSQLERFKQKYKALTLVSIVIGIGSPVVAFILIFFSKQLGLYKGWTRIIGLVLLNVVTAVFIFAFSCKKSRKPFSIKYWKFSITYCIPLIPHFLSVAFLQKIGQLFVDHFCGADIAGIYALANSLALLMMVFNDALTKTLVPWTYQKMSEEKYNDINKPIILSLALIAILDVAMAAVAPELVAIFADKTYAQAVYAVPPLVGVCFFGFLYNTFANIEYYFKETKYVSMASIVAGLVIVLANYILVPRFGFIAAAYASLISYIVYALMHYLFMKKTLDKHLNGKLIYNNNLILKISLFFLGVLVIMPIFYKYIYIRWGIIVLLLIVTIIKRRFIYDSLLVIIKGRKTNESK